MPSDNVYTIKELSQLPEADANRIFTNAQRGDHEALAQLYSSSFDKIFRFIYYRTNHQETAEDLTEEVFVKAFKKLASVRKAGSFEPWLYQIARNTIIDHYRSRKETVDLAEVENVLEYESRVTDSLTKESDGKVLLEQLQKLPTEQRVVLKLKFFEELGNPEIAELLHKSEGAIRVIQYRGLTKLKDLLKTHKNFNND